MGPTPPIAFPPITAEYASTLQRPGAQAPAAPSTYRFSRASDGKTRVDSGNTSVISNPAAAQMIMLDHQKQTATIQPAPPAAPPNPGMPQMPNLSPPGLPAQPQVPSVKVEDLGKTVLQGFQVEGKRFVFPQIAPPKPPGLQMPAVPKTPQIPGMPAVPKIPQMPGMSALPKVPRMPGVPALPKVPQMPGIPAAPAAPQPPATAEVWSSPSMGLPILTKMSGSFGQLTQICHSAIPGEPHPSTFQVPQGYKVIGKGS